MKRHNAMSTRSALVHLLIAAVLIVLGTGGCAGSGHPTATAVDNRVLWDASGNAYHASSNGWNQVTLRRTPDADRK